MKTLAPLALLLCAIGTATVHAADVSVYAIIKAQLFTQTSTAAPVNLPTGAFTFVSTIDRTSAAAVPTATLRRPDATVLSFGPVPGAGSFAVAGQFDTGAALDAAFASGAYLFTINAVNDGTQTPTLNLPANSYPTTPNITNFTAAQNIDWTQPFTLTWTAFAGGNFLDFIQLIITRSNGSRLFATPDFGQLGALSGSATSISIPANTFVPGETYSATLAFGNLLGLPDGSSYPGASGVVAFAKTTQFPMTAPGTRPVLTIAKSAAAGSFDVSWNADIGRRYELRRSQDLLTWTPGAVVTAASTTETWTDTPAPGVNFRFYRLQEPASESTRYWGGVSNGSNLNAAQVQALDDAGGTGGGSDTNGTNPVSFNMLLDDEYLIIAVPQPATVATVSSGGFPIAMQSTYTVSISGTTYNVHRSTNVLSALFTGAGDIDVTFL